MNYLKKNFPIFLLSGSLIFGGISFSPSAQGATATISSLQKEILTLKKQILSLEKRVRADRACSNNNLMGILNRLDFPEEYRIRLMPDPLFDTELC